MQNSVALPISKEKLIELIAASKDYIYSHGIIVRSKVSPADADAVVHAPYTLLPSPVPCACFNQALAVQQDFNLLFHKIAQDRDFLQQSLSSVVKVDEFTRHILDIYQTVHDEGITQPIVLAMNRSDYMFDCRESHDRNTNQSEQSTDINIDESACSIDLSLVKLKQIEFNTMSASFPGLSQRLQKYHRFMLRQLESSEENISNVVANAAADGLAKGMVTAWTLYNNSRAVVLFLSYSVERNIYDHRWLEYSINDLQPQIKVIRRSLKDVQLRGQLDSQKNLFIDGFEVAIVYQRSCYVPADFRSPSDWSTLLMMERSRAVVCPTVGYHLAGTKKIQQELARDGVLERFLADDRAAVQRIRDTFAAQYSLDLTEEGNTNVAMAISDPERFVLKPQREGGGNNTFGADIRTLLTKLKDSPDRASYILMDRIQPITIKNYPIMFSADQSDDAIPLTTMCSELGIYGTLVADSTKVVLNETCGQLLRTKKLGTDEGGVATGYSVLDSPYLIG